jgi:Eukaryotic protein of unknown function (DUF872).
MAKQADVAEKILQKVKGLRAQMQEGEEPQLALPAIWDNGQSAQSVACDVIVTNQRIMGYFYKSFPREHLFLDALNLTDLKQVTWRDKNYEPVFRELLISDSTHRVYIRTPRQKCQTLYDTLKRRANTTENAATSAPQEPTAAAQQEEIATTPEQETAVAQSQQQSIVYGHEEIKSTFKSSSLAILLLLIGGILLEIGGIIAWSASSDASIGLPLLLAGIFAFVVSIAVRRQAQKKA